LRSGNVNICIYRSAVKNLKFGSITPSDLYKLPDLDKRAVSGAVSVYIYPASGQRAVQLVQSVSEARWTLTVGHSVTNPFISLLSSRTTADIRSVTGRPRVVVNKFIDNNSINIDLININQ